MSNEVLFEIGVEELPARFIEQAEIALHQKTTNWLNEHRLPFDSLTTYSTPRRLAIYIKGIVSEQSSLIEKVRGPKLAIAKNNNDEWTKAAIGFAKGQGATVKDIF